MIARQAVARARRLAAKSAATAVKSAATRGKECGDSRRNVERHLLPSVPLPSEDSALRTATPVFGAATAKGVRASRGLSACFSACWLVVGVVDEVAGHHQE